MNTLLRAWLGSIIGVATFFIARSTHESVETALHLTAGLASGFFLMFALSGAISGLVARHWSWLALPIGLIFAAGTLGGTSGWAGLGLMLSFAAFVVFGMCASAVALVVSLTQRRPKEEHDAT